MLPGNLTALRVITRTLGTSVVTIAESLGAHASVARADARIARWSRTMLAVADVKLSVSGVEHLEPGRAYIVMSNHQSHFDIPVLFQAVPLTLRMIAKAELFKIPFFGRAMTSLGIIEVDRSNHARAIASLRAARARIAEGVSVWIAPEGTRSPSGELQAFKKGGFVLALETGALVLPVAITGTREVLPVHSMHVRRGVRVHVHIGRPIAPPTDHAAAEGTAPPPEPHDAGRGRADRDALMAQVRAAIHAGISEGESRLAAASDAG